MSNPSEVKCPRCAAPLPPSAPEGLCPRCLGALNLATDTVLTSADAIAAQPPLTPAELAPHFPQLEIIECLGRGGMGVVYRVRQKALNRLAALKLLAPERVTDAGFAERFTREAQALARLNHPNIVTIYDFGFASAGALEPPSAAQPETPNSKPETAPAGFYFLLMEFMDGVNLRQAMRAGRFTPEQALAIVPPVCEALQYAHEQGIVHRDIKPENLLLDKAGRLKIADFGIAKLVARHSDVEPDAPEPADDAEPSQPPDSTLESRATTAGTPGYMAPEQKSAPQRVDSRADIYSLGVVIYEMLTGELPAEKLQPPSRKVQIDVRLDEIVLRALEQRPELRFQTAAELRTQVEIFEREDREERMAGSGEKRQTPAPPSSPAPTPFLKTASAYVSTPEWLASARGKFWVYTGKGTLVLTRDQLAFTDSQTGAVTTIPLAAIRDVSLGNYPWFTKPAPLHYVSVTWVEGGLTRRHYFTPNRGWFCPVWETNPIVLDWHQALRAAVTAVTGKPPTETPAPPHHPTVSDLVWMGMLFGLPMGLISLVLFNLSRAAAPAEPVSPAAGFVLGLVGLAVVIPFLTLYFLPRWGRQRGGPLHPHAPRKLSPWPTLALAAFCAPLLVHVMMLLTGKVPPEPAHAIGRLVFSLPGTFFLAGLAGVGLWLRHRREAPLHGESSRIRSPGLLVLTPVLLLLGLLCVWFLARFQSPSGVTRFDTVPVGVSNNVVIVDVTTEVGRGNAELRAMLDGPPLPAATEAALADAFFPPFAGTFIKPTPHAGNHPWRILAPGRQTWRLGFVLPDAALARDAMESLHPVGPLPAVPDRTFAGTLFEVRQTNGQVFRASLQVALPFTSADPDWVTVFGHSQHNDTIVTLTWEVLAAGHGLAHFSRAGTPIVTLQPNPETKLHGATILLALTKLGPNRVQLSSRMGRGVAGEEFITEEFPGNFRELADELLRTATFSAKATSGTKIGLFQFQGQPFVVQVHATDSPGTHKVKLGIAAVVGAVGLLLLVAVIWIALRKKQPGAGPATGVGAVLAGCFVLFALLALVWVLRRAGPAGQATEVPAATDALQAAQRIATPDPDGDALTLAETPPVVVQTVPAAGARDVEPGEVDIRVRFSKAMRDGSWSWSEAWPGSTPAMVSGPRFEADRRTCVIRVRLEPGRTYGWWLNSEKFQNFTDHDGRPAVPYLLIFQTQPVKTTNQKTP